MRSTFNSIIFLIGLLGPLFIGMCFGTAKGIQHGWTKAYEAYHQGTLEEEMKIRNPELWIKYNIDNRKKNSKDVGNSSVPR